VFSVALMTLMDSSVLTLLGDNRAEYGRFRLGGTFGYIASSATVGFIFPLIGLDRMFVLYALINAIFILIVLRLPVLPVALRAAGGQRAALGGMLRNPAWVLFMVTVFILWMANTGLYGFLSVALKSMGATDSLVLPEYPLASTHILKPQPLGNQLPHMVVNEHYCMSLARALGLPAAEVSILRTPRPVLAIRRFDREVVQDAGDTWVRRLHIIDACQACDLPVSYKYERNVGSTGAAVQYRDGVSFEKLFGLLQYVNKKAIDKLNLLRWALFQYVIGNCDAHGKNFSFHVGPYGLSAAPWYDLVSVSQYPQMSQEMAMAFGDAFRFEDVKAFPLANFAIRCDIDRRLLVREAQRLQRGVEQHAVALAQSGVYEDEERVFASGIAQQALSASALLATTAREAAKLPSNHL